jgi:hypothetical protein
VLVDLQKTPANLLAQMDDRTARRITEAQEKHKLWCQRCDADDPKVLDEVETMWNAFAVAQKTPRLDRSWLEQIRQAGALDIVAARDPAGSALVFHLVFLTPTRARQLIAISRYKAVPEVAWRSMVSRANSLIHWHNFLSFRARGVQRFDFGGWYPGTTDIRLLGMNTFKKGFGGSVVREFDCEQVISLKGWLGLTLGRWATRLRRAGPDLADDRRKIHEATGLNGRGVSPAFRRHLSNDELDSVVENRS